MDKAGFNTLEAEEILAKAGLEARQAKAMVQVTHKALSEGAATTGDVDKLAGRVDRVETELKAEIGKLDNKIGKLDNKIDKVETELKAEIGKVESRLKVEIAERSSETNAKISETHAKISETHAKISETNAKIAELGKDLTRWGAGGFVAIAGLILVVAVAFLKMGN